MIEEFLARRFGNFLHVLVFTRLCNWLWKLIDPNVKTRLWKVYVTSFGCSLVLGLLAIWKGTSTPEGFSETLVWLVPFYAVFFYFDYRAVNVTG